MYNVNVKLPHWNLEDKFESGSQKCCGMTSVTSVFEALDLYFVPSGKSTDVYFNSLMTNLFFQFHTEITGIYD